MSECLEIRIPEPDNLQDNLPWKRNLLIIWFSQVLSLAGFSFAMPFASLYISEIGKSRNMSDSELAFWVGLFSASAPVTMAIMGPVWGALSDRFGRKIMLIRANVGAVVIIYLMGVIDSIEWLIVLRFLQGAFTGTMTAARTLVSTSTPEHRQGTALGLLTSAQHVGIMGGFFVGGQCIEHYGFAATFKIAGGMLLFAVFLVGFGVKERFIPPRPGQKPVKFEWRGEGIGKWLPKVSFPGWNTVATVLPVLLFSTVIAFSGMFDRPFLPLFVRDLTGMSERAASGSFGYLGLYSGIAAVCASLMVSRFLDVYPAASIGKIAAVCAAIFLIPSVFSREIAGWIGWSPITVLYSLRVMVMFFASVLDPVFQVWLSRSTDPEKRGVIFGWGTTSRAIGWALAPMASALLVSLRGLEAVFLAKAAILMSLVFMLKWTERKMREMRGPEKAGTGVDGQPLSEIQPEP